VGRDRIEIARGGIHRGLERGEDGLPSGAEKRQMGHRRRDNVAGGCPFVALGSEVARGSAAIREAASEGFLATVDRLAEYLPEPDPTAARKAALVLLTTMIGAVTMARVVADETASAALLEGVRQHLTAAF